MKPSPRPEVKVLNGRELDGETPEIVFVEGLSEFQLRDGAGTVLATCTRGFRLVNYAFERGAEQVRWGGEALLREDA